MKEIFKPSDFKGLDGFSLSDCEDVAKACNDKINQLIESWPVVYGSIENGFATNGKQSLATHQARLALIEEIPKEPCKHSPVIKLHGTLSPGLISSTYWNDQEWFCYHCGIKLEAEWKEKK